MKNFMKKSMKGIACLMLLALLTGCKKGSNSEYALDYLAVQLDKGDSWSIIDKNGKVVVKEEYPADAEVTLIRDGVFWVKQGDKWQLFSIDNPKQPLLDEDFTSVTYFCAGRALVSNPNQQIRILDTKGKTVATLPKNIKCCYAFSDEGYAVFVSADNKYGVLDASGKVVVRAEYADMKTSISEGVVLAQKEAEDKTWQIIDMKGKKQGAVDREKYILMKNVVSEGRIIAKDNAKGNAVVLDKTGKKLYDIRKADHEYFSGVYLDGYLIFWNAESKCGVADDKGEVVIRAKYEDMGNLGYGLFGAKKGEKWGIVNAKDETIIDFDYDYVSIVTIGENFLVRDGSEYALIGKDGKEIVSFDDCIDRIPGVVEYVDVEGLANGLLTSIEGYEQPKTAAEKARQHSLSVDDFHYRSYIGENETIGDKIKGNLEISYDGALAEEKTHTEKVDDGWFTYDRTVSDGYHWADVTPVSINGTYTLESDAGIDANLLYKSICEKLATGRKKISDGVFSKMVKFGGKTLECRTTVALSGDDITLNIQFRR